VSTDPATSEDKWLDAALKIFYRTENKEFVDPEMVRMILPTAEEENVEWKYTTNDPGDGWMKSEFNDGSWSRGTGQFGGTNFENVRTEWTTDDIWLRRNVNIDRVGSEMVL